MNGEVLNANTKKKYEQSSMKNGCEKRSPKSSTTKSQ